MARRGYERIVGLTAMGLSCAAPPPAPPSPVSPPMPMVTLNVAESEEEEAPAEEEEDTPPPSAIDEDRVLSLGPAREPFANYIHDVHRRLHPVYVDEFLARLGRRSGRKDGVLLELVIDGRDGALAVVRIVRSSGDEAFDAGVIAAVRRAAPFGAAPHATRSFDGRVYLRWSMHPDPAIACSTRHASPFLLAPPPVD